MDEYKLDYNAVNNSVNNFTDIQNANQISMSESPMDVSLHTSAKREAEVPSHEA